LKDKRKKPNKTAAKTDRTAKSSVPGSASSNTPFLRTCDHRGSWSVLRAAASPRKWLRSASQVREAPRSAPVAAAASLTPDQGGTALKGATDVVRAPEANLPAQLAGLRAKLPKAAPSGGQTPPGAGRPGDQAEMHEAHMRRPEMDGGSKIFLLDLDVQGAVVKQAAERPYASDDFLQRELTRRPELIPGDEVNPDVPRQWMLISRDVQLHRQVRDWSRDHLLIDQDGVPGFIECRFAPGPELERAALSRLLQMAADAADIWPEGKAFEAARAMFSKGGQSIERATAEFIETDSEEQVEAFWRQVDRNIAEGRVRLIMAGRSFSRETRRLAGYLSAQMVHTELLTVEIKLYETKNALMLVPRLVNQPKLRAQRPQLAPRRTSPERVVASLTDASFRATVERFMSVSTDLGLTLEAGDTGISWRLPQNGAPVIAWFFPPGQQGPGGVSDFTLGYDAGAEDRLPEETAVALHRYVNRLKAIPTGAEPPSWVHGARFSEAAAVHSEEQILDAVRRLVKKVREEDD
jgi:hypothetical protein